MKTQNYLGRLDWVDRYKKTKSRLYKMLKRRAEVNLEIREIRNGISELDEMLGVKQ